MYIASGQRQCSPLIELLGRLVIIRVGVSGRNIDGSVVLVRVVGWGRVVGATERVRRNASLLVTIEVEFECLNNRFFRIKPRECIRPKLPRYRTRSRVQPVKHSYFRTERAFGQRCLLCTILLHLLHRRFLPVDTEHGYVPAVSRFLVEALLAYYAVDGDIRAVIRNRRDPYINRTTNL